MEKTLFAAKVSGCLLGGALADARGPLGQHGRWPASAATALSAYTVDGLTEALEWANSGVVADETACLWLAYLRWLAGLQALPDNAPMAAPRWIDSQSELRSAFDGVDPDTLAALRSGEMGTMGRPLNAAAAGPGALVRSAGFGLIPHVDLPTIHRLSRNGAALTHGHPTARDAAGGFSVVIRLLMDTPAPGSAHDALVALRTAYTAAVDFLQTIPGQQDVISALTVDGKAASMRPASTALEVLGDAIAFSLTGGSLYGLASGLNTSAAVLVGNLLGALHGEAALPAEELDQLAATAALRQLAVHWVDCTAA